MVKIADKMPLIRPRYEFLARNISSSIKAKATMAAKLAAPTINPTLVTSERWVTFPRLKVAVMPPISATAAYASLPEVTSPTITAKKQVRRTASRESNSKVISMAPKATGIK